MKYVANNLSFNKNESTLLVLARDYGQQALKYLLITSIVLITLSKLNLIGTGFLAFPDEIRYCQSGRVVQHLSELKIDAAMKEIFSTQGRPADAIIKIIPNAIQYVTARIFKINYYERKNSYPLFIFNFLIYCLILIVHYKLSNLLLKDSFLALVSVLLFSTLTNSYLYLRHALPYDMGLLILYIVIYKIALYTEEDNLSYTKSLIIGMCSLFGLLVYPGYFPLLIVGLFILLFNKISKENIFKKIYYAGYYILGSILCLILCEKIARLVGKSYILDAIGLSKTITQGSFEESFAYLFKYFIEVEGLTGIILLIGLLVFISITLYRFKNKTFKQYSLISLLGIGLIGMYLVYASTGYFFHKMVFYGRLLHQYVPFICILSIYSINETLTKVTRKSQLILCLISIIFIGNFWFSFINYNSYSYPRDILWQLIKENKLNGVGNVLEFDDSWPVMPKGSELICTDIHGKPINSYYNIIEVGSNFGGTIYIVNELTKHYIFNPNDNYHLLQSKPSFMNFKAYQYDSGANMIDRHNMDKMNMQIKIFTPAGQTTGFISQKKVGN
ncbi:MAG: hypothetical protein WC600_09560 [Desulfobaccales bacterium]